MRVLLDHNLPRGLRKLLIGHEVKTAREMRWESLKNGILLRTAADAGFDAFLSIDKNLRYEQNLMQLPLPVIVLNCVSNALPELLPFVPHLDGLLNASIERCAYVVLIDGTIERFGGPVEP